MTGSPAVWLADGCCAGAGTAAHRVTTDPMLNIDGKVLCVIAALLTAWVDRRPRWSIGVFITGHVPQSCFEARACLAAIVLPIATHTVVGPAQHGRRTTAAP